MSVDELLAVGKVVYFFDEEVDFAYGMYLLVIEGKEVAEIGVQGHDAGVGEASADVKDIAGGYAFGKEVGGDLAQQGGFACAALSGKDLDELVADVSDDWIGVGFEGCSCFLHLARPAVALAAFVEYFVHLVEFCGDYCVCW